VAYVTAPLSCVIVSVDVAVFGSDTTNGFRRNFLGRLADVNGFTDDNVDRRSANLVIKETF